MAPVIPEEQPSSPVGEGQQFSRGAHTARQTMSWAGSEMSQGAQEIPRVSAASAGATIAGILGGAAASTIGEDSVQQELRNINAQLARIEETNNQATSQLENRALRAENRVAQLESWWFYRWFGGCLGAPVREPPPPPVLYLDPLKIPLLALYDWRGTSYFNLKKKIKDVWDFCLL